MADNMESNRLNNAGLVGNILIGCIFLIVQGCGTISPVSPDQERFVLYEPEISVDNFINKHAPLFLIEENEKDFNRIGTPSVDLDDSGDQDVFIDTEKATYYTLTQNFSTSKGTYTNLIYRIHFSKTPLPHLTAGKNVGLLVYITLNEDKKPLLITTLHTCGCYLGFIPTTYLKEDAKPDMWQPEKQMVYGVTLPSFISGGEPGDRLVIKISSETHRVIDLLYTSKQDLSGFKRTEAAMKPMSGLNNLSPEGDEPVSFFETKGFRKGYVKGSRKRLEMLFMSWWAMDFFVGEDKALGPPEETGTVFYTTLKFWDRKNSNIWFFPDFLNYWGWKL